MIRMIILVVRGDRDDENFDGSKYKGIVHELLILRSQSIGKLLNPKIWADAMHLSRSFASHFRIPTRVI